jgi:hypothetical protein
LNAAVNAAVNVANQRERCQSTSTLSMLSPLLSTLPVNAANAVTAAVNATNVVTDA